VSWRVILEDGAIAAEGIADKGSMEQVGAGNRSNSGRRWLTIQKILPCGYHRLDLDDASMPLIIVPRRCWLPPILERGAKVWGIAAQLYLLRSETNWGIGDFHDLNKLIEIGSGWGADAIGLNPLHAMFMDDPRQASPYAPVSRLFLNILNIDVTDIPEFAASEARSTIDTQEFREALEKVRTADLVDYQNVAKLKLDALRIVFGNFQKSAPPQRRLAFETFVRGNDPALRRFSIFQAIRNQQATLDSDSTDWRRWPEQLRDYQSPAVERFAAEHHEEIEFLSWMQWIADGQLANAAESARRHGMTIGLYRDLAVGAHAAGAETWLHPRTVVSAAHAGAPPDILNPAGQDWGLPPFDPVELRETAYAAFIDLVRANMRHAGGLRIDHVVGLQHLYWVPRGLPPSSAAFVTYPFEDLAGILALESWRNECLVVGEDLGTVPAGFRDMAAEHGVLSYRVLYFEQDERSGAFIPPEKYPNLALATVGSHDLATLRGWWEERDIEIREIKKLYPDSGEAGRQRAQRAQEKRLLLQALRQEGLDPGSGDDHERLLRAVHSFLGRTRAAIVMVQSDNLTGEVMQVNLPGTTTEHPNWRRRQSMTLAEIAADPGVKAVVEAVNRARLQDQG
jgi:4-alpha-glucanotransferase